MPKPATFDFLGFTHICKRSRRGKFTIHVRTMRKRLRRSLKKVTVWCQEHRHDPVEEQQESLEQEARGPLPVLRATDELPESLGVLSVGPSDLEEMAQPADTRKDSQLG